MQYGPHDVDVPAADLPEYAVECSNGRCADTLMGIQFNFDYEVLGLDKAKALRRAADAGDSHTMFHPRMMVIDGVASA